MAEIPNDPVHLEARLSAVQAVGSIVRALWALSRAQLGQVDQFSREATAYLDWVDEIKERITGPAVTHLTAAESLVVVLGPERPFCAGLPGEVLRALPRVRHLGFVGRRLSTAAHSIAGQRILASAEIAFELAGPSSVHELDDTAQALAAAIVEHGQQRPVTLFHPQVATVGLRRIDLLSERQQPRAHFDFESYSAYERLLEYAVRESITGNLRVALTETLRVEVRARANAAESAKRAVEKRAEALQASLRIMQQEQTTNELAELFAGSLAPRR